MLMMARPSELLGFDATGDDRIRKHIYKSVESCQVCRNESEGGKLVQGRGRRIGDRCIAAVGAYAPLLRLDRAAAAKALKFSGLGGRAQGFRAVAGWDEDALTLARRGGARSESRPDAVVFASTSAPFIERSHATLLVDALALTPRNARERRRWLAPLRGLGACWTRCSGTAKR